MTNGFFSLFHLFFDVFKTLFFFLFSLIFTCAPTNSPARNYSTAQRVRFMGNASVRYKVCSSRETKKAAQFTFFRIRPSILRAYFWSTISCPSYRHNSICSYYCPSFLLIAINTGGCFPTLVHGRNGQRLQRSRSYALCFAC